MNTALIAVALLSAAAVFGFLAFLTRRRSTATVTAHRAVAVNPLKAKVVSAPSGSVGGRQHGGYDAPLPMELQTQAVAEQKFESLGPIPEPWSQDAATVPTEDEPKPISYLPELPPLVDFPQVMQPAADDDGVGHVHVDIQRTWTAEEFPTLPPVPEIAHDEFVAPPVPVIEEPAVALEDVLPSELAPLQSTDWNIPLPEEPVVADPLPDLLPAVAVAAELPTAEPTPAKRRGFMDQPGDMPWLTPIESLPAADEAGAASQSAETVNATATLNAPTITWTRAFTDAELGLDARLELAQKAIMLDDSQMLDHIVTAFLEDPELRPAIHAALEFYRPRCARVLYFTLLQHGDAADAMLAVDGLISYGRYTDLRHVLARESIGEYAAFQLAAKVDLDKYLEESGVSKEVADKLRGCVAV